MPSPDIARAQQILRTAVIVEEESTKTVSLVFLDRDMWKRAITLLSGAGLVDAEKASFDEPSQTYWLQVKNDRIAEFKALLPKADITAEEQKALSYFLSGDIKDMATGLSKLGALYKTQPMPPEGRALWFRRGKMEGSFKGALNAILHVVQSAYDQSPEEGRKLF